MRSKSSTPPKLELAVSPKPWKPHKYQKKAVTWLLEHALAALFLDPGLGKTSITLAAIKIMMNAGMMERVLIIAPLRVMYNVWVEQVKEWADFNHLRVVVLHGKDKEAALREDADIYLVNPEGLYWLMVNSRWKLIRPDALVVDESSKFKNSTTKRFRALRAFLPKFRYRWILTGSPAPNGLLDIFGQVYLMDLGRSLGEFITHYRRKYFAPTGHEGFDWKLKDDAKSEKEIYKALKPYVLRLKAEDHLDMPALVENVVRVTLPDAARRAYEDMEAEMFHEMDSGEKLMALSAAAASGKCRQIANGGIYRHDQQERLLKSEKWVPLHDAKTEALRELVDELQGSPILVGYEYDHDRQRLVKEFGKNTPWIGGGVSQKRTTEILRAWNAGDIPVLLGHPAAMAHGLNAQAGGHHIAWYGMPWDFELYDQFIRRLWRQGNKATRVFVHYLVAAGTVDEAVLRALRNKQRTQNRLLDALKTYRTDKFGPRRKAA